MAGKPAWMEIDLAALGDNFDTLHRLSGGKKFIAAIKADGYGHGAVEAAHALAERGADMLATASYDEAVAVREAGITGPVLTFGGDLPEAAPAFLRHDLTPSLDTMAAAQAVAKAATRPTDVFVKIDCGFGRFGVAEAEARSFIRQVASLPNLVVAGIYTHLPFSDTAGLAWARQRLPVFHALIDDLRAAGIDPPFVQAIASAGVLIGIEDRGNAVCCGHLLYGLPPVEPALADCSNFRPVLRAIRARLVQVSNRPPDNDGDAGYLAHGVRTTGVVPLGLAHGYAKPAPGQRGVMLLRGRPVPILRVTLESSVLDLSDVETPRLGETVTALGTDGDASIGIDDLAAWRGTTPLGIIMSFAGRLSRHTMTASTTERRERVA